MPLAGLRIRIPLDVPTKPRALQDVFTGETPIFWKGNDVSIEVGLLNDGVVDIITNLSFIKVVISSEDRATAYVTINVPVADFNVTLTQAQWDGRANQHFKVPIASADLNLLSWTGATNNEKAFWLSFTAVTTDIPAKTIDLGAGKIKLVNSGGGNTATSPTPGPPTSWTKEEADVRFMGGVTKIINDPGVMTTYVTPDGLWKRVIGVKLDADGNPVRVDDFVANTP